VLFLGHFKEQVKNFKDKTGLKGSCRQRYTCGENASIEIV
jgi:hypothetical protein